MGFFSKEESEKIKLPPAKKERQLCWEKRDIFFACLTANNIDNSLDAKELPKVQSKCGIEKKQFEDNCVKSWVKHFQDKRFSDLTRERYIAKLEAEGAQPFPIKLESTTIKKNN
ncbi:Cytochrome c oxidase assembly factor 6 [Spathaspora sp. JA1]|nr:Cytochrome c oxidase assembly factor 6 [Spathaspora sp. JA1]